MTINCNGTCPFCLIGLLRRVIKFFKEKKGK